MALPTGGENPNRGVVDNHQQQSEAETLEECGADEQGGVETFEGARKRECLPSAIGVCPNGGEYVAKRSKVGNTITSVTCLKCGITCSEGQGEDLHLGRDYRTGTKWWTRLGSPRTWVPGFGQKVSKGNAASYAPLVDSLRKLIQLQPRDELTPGFLARAAKKWQDMLPDEDEGKSLDASVVAASVAAAAIPAPAEIVASKAIRRPKAKWAFDQMPNKSDFTAIRSTK